MFSNLNDLISTNLPGSTLPSTAGTLGPTNLQPNSLNKIAQSAENLIETIKNVSTNHWIGFDDTISSI